MVKYQRYCPRCGSTNTGFGLPLGKFKYAVGAQQSYSCKSCGYSQINPFPESAINQLKKIKKKIQNKSYKEKIDLIPSLPYESLMSHEWYRLLSGALLIIFFLLIIWVIYLMFNS